MLGTTQTISWASSNYLPAVLATPVAASVGIPPVLVLTAFSLSLIVSAIVGPLAGSCIDRFGGPRILMLSNIVLVSGLLTLAFATSAPTLFVGWAIFGIGMGGLYEAAFATLAAPHGHKARGPLTGITLVAGFASTLGWPLSSYILTGSFLRRTLAST